MPSIDLKQAQKQLEKGELYSVYWIFGPERLKAQELLKRIKTVIFGDQEPGDFSFERLDGTEVSGPEIVDRSRTMLFGASIRLVLVQQAHAIKESDALADLLGDGKPHPVSELESVCVFLSKDLDKRKKISKKFLDLAACVEVAEVEGDEREAWIRYLARRRKLELNDEVVNHLVVAEPWSLDGVERELEKFEIGGVSPDLFLEMVSDAQSAERFVRVFFRRELRPALEAVPGFSSEPDAAIPLLGLLSWTSRNLQAFKAGDGAQKFGPWISDRLKEYAPRWSLDELAKLDREIGTLDYKSKQTASEPLGLWGSLSVKFCK